MAVHKLLLLQMLSFEDHLASSFDSSVGRAVDCSGKVIHRSLVRIRLEGLNFFLSSYSIISSFFFFFFLSNTATEIHRMYFCVFVPEGEIFFFVVLLSRN